MVQEEAEKEWTTAEPASTKPTEFPRPVLPENTSVQQLAVALAATANAKGGTLLMGREGLQDVAAAREKVIQAGLLCEPPLSVPPLQITHVEEKQLLSISVPAGLPHVYSVGGRYWLRQGSRNQVLGGRQVQQLIMERGLISGTFAAFESLPVPNATLGDMDWDRVREYVKSSHRPLAGDVDVVSIESLAKVLTRLGGLIVKEGQCQPSYAGILLFGLAPEQFLPSSEITLVRYAGVQMGDEFLREDVRGPLPEQIRRAEAFLVGNMRRGSRLVGWRREEQTEYPIDAVREAVVNAVAHRDYSVQGEGIRILMFADRLEVYSPGRLPGHVTVENIVEERFSRNPVIVQLLADLGFIECLGYGIDRMITLMEDAHLPRPVFQETANGFKVVLYGQGEHLVSEGADPSRWAHLNLNERQVRALEYLTQNDRISNRAYQELCPDISPETIRRDLVELVNRGLLLKVGDKKATYYIFK